MSEQSKWQPIETAPRDGTRVLAASSLDGRAMFVEIAKWNCDTKDPKWVSWYGTPVVQPTHWQPLPEPPHV